MRAMSGTVPVTAKVCKLNRYRCAAVCARYIYDLFTIKCGEFIDEKHFIYKMCALEEMIIIVAN